MAETGKTAGAGAKAAKKPGAKAGPKGDPKVLGQVARMLMRAIWVQQWQASHPGAKPETRKAAWDEVRETLASQNLQTYRKALTALTKAGVVITLPAGAGKPAAKREDKDQD